MKSKPSALPRTETVLLAIILVSLSFALSALYRVSKPQDRREPRGTGLFLTVKRFLFFENHMNYNASEHTIEFPDGRTAAELTSEIDGAEGFEIADNWGNSSAAITELREELEETEKELSDLVGKAKDNEDLADKLEEELLEAEEKISALEAELEEKGEPKE